MEIRVSGHQIDTGDALKTRVSTRLHAIADKYFTRALSAHVIFGNAPHGAFQCDIVCHVMTGLLLKGRSEAQDVHVAFDLAAERIEKQLRRYMRRLKARHVQATAAEAERTIELTVGNAGYTVFQGGAEDEEAAEAPVVVAEMRVDIPETSVSDAVMMLDLRDTNALLFLNSGTTSLNMVYRRNDGTIGWVEPAR